MNSPLHFQLFEHSKSAPWVVLIHGLFGNMDNLSVIRRELEKHLNVLTIDLPDHGESTHNEHFSVQMCVTSLKALLIQCEIESATFIGHSLGGKVAMLMALTHEQYVDKLIVLDIAPVTYPARHDAVFKGLNNVNLSEINGRKDADKALSAYIDEAGIRQFLLKSLYQKEDKQWSWRFNLPTLQSSYDQIRAFPSISNSVYKKDVWFIKGAQSDYISDAHRETIGALFPNAKARVVAGTGHWLHAEKPKAVNTILCRILSLS